MCCPHIALPTICCFTFGFTAVQLLVTLHCLALVVCLPRPPLELPAHVARCCEGHSHTPTSPSPRFNLRHQDRPDACKGIEIELSEILLPLCPSDHHPDCSCYFFLSSTAVPLASYSSVHEPRRHVIGSAEQDIGVVPAWLGLVGEPVCVVESFQRGVDVVVVPTRRVPCTPMGYNGRRRRMRKTSARGKNQGLVFSKYCKYMRANICLRLARVSIGKMWKL